MADASTARIETLRLEVMSALSTKADQVRKEKQKDRGRKAGSWLDSLKERWATI